MSDIKLKPCPFCGSGCVNDTTPPEFNDIMGFYWVCPDCVACGPASDTVYLATTRWNGRAEDVDTHKALAEQNKAMKAALTDLLQGDKHEYLTKIAIVRNARKVLEQAK